MYFLFLNSYIDVGTDEFNRWKLRRKEKETDGINRKEREKERERERDDSTSIEIAHAGERNFFQSSARSPFVRRSRCSVLDRDHNHRGKGVMKRRSSISSARDKFNAFDAPRRSHMHPTRSQPTHNGKFMLPPAKYRGMEFCYTPPSRRPLFFFFFFSPFILPRSVFFPFFFIPFFYIYKRERER